mmetsp:Transcript_40590/g.36012  ORF Transcript_40590/g.36012 Transcript_40590/m.36012 type:complete len:84 (+) Transcript_40590:1067-1318(+)
MAYCPTRKQIAILYQPNDIRLYKPNLDLSSIELVGSIKLKTKGDFEGKKRLKMRDGMIVAINQNLKNHVTIYMLQVENGEKII